MKNVSIWWTKSLLSISESDWLCLSVDIIEMLWRRRTDYPQHWYCILFVEESFFSSCFKHEAFKIQMLTLLVLATQKNPKISVDGKPSNFLCFYMQCLESSCPVSAKFTEKCIQKDRLTMKSRWLKRHVLQEKIFLNALQRSIFIDRSPALHSVLHRARWNLMWLQ